MRLAEKQVAERHMDGAGERFELLQSRLNRAALPFGQFLELPRQVFLRNLGLGAPARPALTRPAKKLGIDGNAGHGAASPYGRRMRVSAMGQ